ncbi:hypothetical protein CFR80_14325 [Komagataeibacter oboediens]|uniref:Uncharacterized protein n=1 Tax=Komagataeibacter oboediens TaxID=65958 RepID=A0A318QLY7_9PROT|nr:hypothetical protein [Komagataeibacter oboediens]PYD80055.1 hypothetical protein CFR80_14325 [Komagataeibacter oboediens]
MPTTQTTTAAGPTPAPAATTPAETYVVTLPGYGYRIGTKITDAATIARLKTGGILSRFTVRVAAAQEK